MPVAPLPPALAARRRRARRVYLAAVTVVVVALGVVVAVVIGTGEAANATLRTSAAAPALPGGTVRADPTAVWSLPDTAAGGEPLYVGTVVTLSGGTLTGRSALTGQARWSYSRSDATICDATVDGDRASVLYRRGDTCDELNTFAADTGVRGWFRTFSSIPDPKVDLMDEGDARLQVGPNGLLVVFARSFRYVADNGVDRFSSATATSGCTFTAVVAGTTGVLSSERCGDGDHLAFWSNDAKDGKPQQLWRVATAAPVTALAASDAVGFGYDADRGTVTGYSLDDGAARGDLALDPAPSGSASPALTSGSDTVVRIGGRVYGWSREGEQLWSAPATGTPTFAAVGVGESTDTEILVPDGTTVRRLGAGDGRTVATYSLPAEADRVYLAGGGLLGADPGVAYLR